MNPLLGQSSNTLNLLHFQAFELQTGLLAARLRDVNFFGGVKEANLQYFFWGVGPTPPKNIEEAVGPPQKNIEDRVSELETVLWPHPLSVRR